MDVNELVSSYVLIRKNLNSCDLQLNSIIVNIIKAVNNNEISEENLNQLILRNIIEREYPSEDQKEVDSGESSSHLKSSDIIFHETWINIITNDKGKIFKFKDWSSFFPRLSLNENDTDKLKSLRGIVLYITN